jgi:hypothetical protein
VAGDAPEEDLVLYTDAAAGAPGFEAIPVRDLWADIVRRGGDLVDEISDPSSLRAGNAPLGMSMVRKESNFVVVRHAFCEPDGVTEAFDQWISSGGQVGVEHGELVAREVRPDRLGALRVVRGNVRLHFAPGVKVELELASWGRWNTMLALSPVGRGRYAASSRRSVWFAGAGRLLEALRDLLVGPA